MKILMTGATGFVGSHLLPELERAGHQLVILSRDSEKAKAKFGAVHKYFKWDYTNGSPSKECFEGVEAIIHLMGEGIAEKRWSERQKKIIIDSRVKSSELLADAANKHLNKPLKVFVSASAVGFYDLNGDATVTEDTPRGNGFLAEVCGAWEDAARKLTAAERHVIFRIGVVLGHGGGAMAKMLLPFKMGVGGILGTGKQFMNWIHVQDLVGMIVGAVDDKRFSGVYNAVSPHNATNFEFTKALGKVLRRPTILPAPAFALKIALGEMSDLLLKGQNIKPKRLMDLGFEFKFANLVQALEEACLVREFPELKKKVRCQRVMARQWLPHDIHEVHAFFSDARILERITPSSMKFRFISESTPKIQQGTVHDYQLTVWGVPIRWRALITCWEPPSKFIDFQIKGPFGLWQHIHRFVPYGNGTWIVDEIYYRMPNIPVLSWIASPFVHRDVKRIFLNRQKTIEKIFEHKQN